MWRIGDRVTIPEAGDTVFRIAAFDEAPLEPLVHPMTDDTRTAILAPVVDYLIPETDGDLAGFTAYIRWWASELVGLASLEAKAYAVDDADREFISALVAAIVTLVKEEVADARV